MHDDKLDAILRHCQNIEDMLSRLMISFQDLQVVIRDTKRLGTSAKDLQAALDAQRRATPPVKEKTEGNT